MIVPVKIHKKFGMHITSKTKKKKKKLNFKAFKKKNLQ